MEKPHDFVMSFDCWQRLGRCRVRAWPSRGVIVVTEIDDNPGPSVTNAAEAVRDALRFELWLMFETLKRVDIVEHYEKGTARSATFDIVTFGSDGYAKWHTLPPRLEWVREAIKEAA